MIFCIRQLDLFSNYCKLVDLARVSVFLKETIFRGVDDSCLHAYISVRV